MLTGEALYLLQRSDLGDIVAVAAKAGEFVLIPPGPSRDPEGVFSDVDAVVVFARHKEYQGLEPARLRELCGSAHPAVVDGRNIVDSDAWMGAEFIYRGIG